MDAMVASILLVGLSPLILLTAVLVRWRLGTPVLFQQERGGKDGRTFRVQKFRSMTDARGEDGQLLSDAVRLTSFGKLLRAASLDELPQLLNVLNGDMSLIGPRPLLAEYMQRYNAHQARRHEVRPGITGWAQVHGRNAIGWEDRFDHDVYYVDNYSFWMDCRILALTVLKVFRPSGVSSGSHATMERFMGTPNPNESPNQHD